MKRIIGLFAIFIIVTGCSSDRNEVLNGEIVELQSVIQSLQDEIARKETVEQQLMNEISSLNVQLEEAQGTIQQYEHEKYQYAAISNLALEFVRGHTQGDTDQLQSVISDEIILREEDGILYGAYDANGTQVEYVLYDRVRQSGYLDMVIQGYGYDAEKDQYLIHIREFYQDEDGQPVSPPTFLNLAFQLKAEGWKVTSFEFDI